jgi:hypothetical protein
MGIVVATVGLVESEWKSGIDRNHEPCHIYRVIAQALGLSW